LLGCKTKKELPYRIFADGDDFNVSSVDLEPTLWIDSTFNSDNVAQDFIEIKENDDVKEVENWMNLIEDNDSLIITRSFISDTVLVQDSTLVFVNEIDTLIQIAALDTLVKTEVTSLVNDSSLIVVDRLDSLTNTEEVLMKTDSIIVKSDTVFNDTLSNVWVGELDSIHVFDTTFIAASLTDYSPIDSDEVKQLTDLYIIDKSIGANRIVTIEIDTLKAIEGNLSKRNVIVFRKSSLKLVDVKWEKPVPDLKVDSAKIEVPLTVVKEEIKPFELYYTIGKVKTTSLTALEDLIFKCKVDASLDVFISSSTDASGGDASNLKLSQQRAIDVKDILVKSGVEEKRIYIQYLGEKYASMPFNENERKTTVILK
jgi:hypothetical protein